MWSLNGFLCNVMALRPSPFCILPLQNHLPNWTYFSSGETPSLEENNKKYSVPFWSWKWCQCDLGFFCTFPFYCTRPKKKKKKKDVCLSFSDRPKILENRGHLFFFFFFFNSQFCIFKQNCQNKMSEYIVTVPKRHFIPAVMDYNSFQHRIKPFLGLFMPKNAHTWMTLIPLCPEFWKKKKKIDLPTLPIFNPKRQTNLIYFQALHMNQYQSFVHLKFNN